MLYRDKLLVLVLVNTTTIVTEAVAITPSGVCVAIESNLW